jgi:2-polyprenyl-3-methyl-5-hydroxy-6-metoxy-1,4-benzoquinol methylase
MTPSSSLAVKLVSRPARAASFFLKTIWAAFVLLCVCLLWLLLFVLFLPFLLLSLLLGWKVDEGVNDVPVAPASGLSSANENTGNQELIFDRRNDVSKLFGCNTRNVHYRWSIFSRRLAGIRSEYPEPHALDFGAGSLRDSFELSKLGFNVVSVDLNNTLLERYRSYYDWQKLPSTPRLFTDTLDDLLQQTGPNHFDLAIAFDVVEHLEYPAATVDKIHSLLHDQGLLFTIVPNRRNFFERYFKYNIRRQREKGIPWIPGVPHLQFKTPAEWKEFFEQCGFTILERDMAIGSLVNNWWIGLLGLPIRIWVSPVLAMLAYVFHFKFDAAAFERMFSPPWLMERVNTWDARLKKYTSDSFAWNLIVAQKKSLNPHQP